MEDCYKRYTLTVECAVKVREWIRDRGGAQVFRSIDLSDPTKTLLVPVRGPDGEAVGKPHWSMADTPERIITAEDECEVTIDKEVKRFHVGVRMGGSGLRLKVTDGGSRRIRAAVEKAGDGSYHVFDYSMQEAVIMAPVETIPMENWNVPKEPEPTTVTALQRSTAPALQTASV